MANYTPNLNLEKPLQSEDYDVDIFNANADKIDNFAGQIPARALTADKLTSGAKINGVNFKGDSDIVTGAGFYYDTVTYGAGDLAFIYNQNDALELHKSLSAGNIGHNPLTTTGYWEKQVLGGGGGSRNIGEIVSSTLPLVDAGLHLLDGTRLSGDGIYGDFVNYIAELYDESSKKSNVTKIGSLTDNNGVLSGFSTNNYARTPLNFKPVSNSWEIATKFNISAVGTTQALYGGGGVDQRIILGINANGQPYVSLSHSTGGGSFDIGAITLDTILNLNVDYWIKCQFTGTAYILSLSTNGITYNITKTLQSTTIIYDGAYPLSIGANQYVSGVNIPLNGSIDLKDSYININGQRWWTGANPSWATNEAQWQQSISTYGVCGKFVYNSTNNTVRLPKITGIIDGTTDVNALGDLIEAGLPNITATWGSAYEVNSSAWQSTGAVTSELTSGGYMEISGVQGDKISRTFNASLSSSIYGNSTTVQPQTIKAFYYIVIATSTKTDIQVDIDEIVTDLNGKAGTDLTNVTNTGYIKMAGAGMPSDRYIDLTLGASGTTYTAPANGWVMVTQAFGNAYYLGVATLYSDEDGICMQQAYSSSGAANVYIPVQKNEIFKVYYGGTKVVDNVNRFQFIYAQGSESEAQ